MFPLKVAVAMAIIKSKPEDLSGQKYAELLQRKFMLKQSKLESDYADARLKISKLEEQISKRGTRQEAEVTEGADTIHIIPPPSLNDTQCKTNPGQFGGCYNIELVSSEVENSKFIQTVVSLHNMASSFQHCQSDDMIATAIEKISSLSSGLSSDLIVLPESCLCKASEAITKLLRCHSWLEDINKIMESVCHFIETILSKLKGPSNPHQFPPHRRKHSLMQMLVTFLSTSSAQLSMLVLDSLMDSWEEFCHKLHNSRKMKVPLDPQVFESGYFIIRATELTVKSWIINCSSTFEVLHDLQRRLEKSLSHLVQFFPLIAHAVWKVTALIEKNLGGGTALI